MKSNTNSILKMNINLFKIYAISIKTFLICKLLNSENLPMGILGNSGDGPWNDILINIFQIVKEVIENIEINALKFRRPDEDILAYQPYSAEPVISKK